MRNARMVVKWPSGEMYLWFDPSMRYQDGGQSQTPIAANELWPDDVLIGVTYDELRPEQFRNLSALHGQALAEDLERFPKTPATTT